MPKSFIRGDYSLVMAIESASQPNNWYRLLADRNTGILSCDCPPWTFAQQRDTTGERTCPHTRFASQLIHASSPTEQRTQDAAQSMSTQTCIQAVQGQWPGLQGQWAVEQKTARINNKPYHLVLLRFQLGNGSGSATAAVAFAERHPITRERMIAGIAGWCGYTIAAEVARLGGYPMAGQPPEHFRVHPSRRRQQQPPAEPGEAPSSPFLPPIGFVDILRIGDEARVIDGLRPAQRAEQTLRLFLGDALYTQLEEHGFLDVSSVQYGIEKRVYRLRRDPSKQRERRVRVFEHGRYIRDYCLVRGQDVPEADHFLTVFLGLLSDEVTTLSVVGKYNIFNPNSDGNEREILPVSWRAREPVQLLH